jgi:hypothetical protein
MRRAGDSESCHAEKSVVSWKVVALCFKYLRMRRRRDNSDVGAVQDDLLYDCALYSMQSLDAIRMSHQFHG